MFDLNDPYPICFMQGLLQSHLQQFGNNTASRGGGAGGASGLGGLLGAMGGPGRRGAVVEPLVADDNETRCRRCTGIEPLASGFYIRCDACFDWFHPECVGALRKMSMDTLLSLQVSRTLHTSSFHKYTTTTRHHHHHHHHDAKPHSPPVHSSRSAGCAAAATAAIETTSPRRANAKSTAAVRSVLARVARCQAVEQRACVLAAASIAVEAGGRKGVRAARGVKRATAATGNLEHSRPPE